MTRRSSRIHRTAGDVAFGSSPTARDLEALVRGHGFRSILNLNTEGERGEVLSPNVEATWAHTFGAEHRRVSTEPRGLEPEDVERFLAELDSAPLPVYVHSRGGHRAAALALVHDALARDLGGREALDEAAERGVDLEPSLATLVVREVDRRRAA